MEKFKAHKKFSKRFLLLGDTKIGEGMWKSRSDGVDECREYRGQVWT